MRAWTLKCFILAWVVGCAATRVRHTDVNPIEYHPPVYNVRLDGQDPQLTDASLENLAKGSSTEGVRWWVMYRRAQLWREKSPTTSCSLLTELAETKEFPLHREAALRAAEVCDDKLEADLAGAMNNPKNNPEWLHHLAVDIGTERARKSQELPKLVQLLLMKSKSSLQREEKIQLAQEALIAAEKIGDEKLITSVRKRLHSLAPSLKPDPKPEDYVAVAQDYRRLRRFNEARDFYARHLKRKGLPLKEKYQTKRSVAMTYKLERNHDQHLAEMQALAKELQKEWKKRPAHPVLTKMHHDIGLETVRAQWTLGDVKGARSQLEFLSRNLGKRYSQAEIFWLFGRMAEEKQEFKVATQWFEKSLQHKITDPEFRDKITWYLAWNEMKQGLYKPASLHLSEGKSTTQNPYSRAKFAFWLGRTLHQNGQITEAKTEFAQLAQDDPMGYYGLLAKRELKEPIRFPTQVTPSEADHQESFLGSLDPLYVQWLISVEERDVARRYLDSVAKSYRRQKRQSQHDWLTLLNYYAQAGIYLDLFSQLGQLPPTQRTELLALQPQLVFPTPYLEVVREVSNKFGISGEFIFSIIRQESAFNPWARSNADAFGLMQLLPEVAEQLAPQLNVAYQGPNDLFDPQKNITIGGYFLKQLWDRHQGQFILAAASYNASDRAIRTWLSTRYRGDALAFVEDIPYEETQGYVKLVLRNLIFYQIVIEKKESVEFPEWSLTLKAQPDA